MTKEQYLSLKLDALKAIARERGITGASRLRKAELIDQMLHLDAAEAANAAPAPGPEGAAPVSEPKAAASAPAPAAVRPSPAPGAIRPASEMAAARPAPAPEAIRPAPEMAAARPAPAPGAIRPAPEMAAARPAPAPEAIRPAPEIETARPAPTPEAIKPVSGPETVRPASGPETGRYQEMRGEAGPAARQTSGGEGGVTSRQEEPDRSGPRQFLFSENASKARGILELHPDGFGFLRSWSFQQGEEDVYVSPSQIRRFSLRTGDVIEGIKRENGVGDKNAALLFVSAVNGFKPDLARRRPNFEALTPVFPYERIRLEQPGGSTATRVVDLISPIGKGQRGMIVSPPKAGKTTLLKDIAKSILTGDPEAHLMILLVDERPEEVTDMKESVTGVNVEIIYSTFDEQPEHHMRVAEMVIERAKRLVEHHEDVIILLDSITRLTRAYNLLVPPSGRTLSGGLDPAALYAPKRFFGAARKMREGGSLTILATALVDTGSKMDDVVYEEFKGTGNMELILDRKLQERRIFPAIDITKSGTRREDLLLSPEELRAVYLMRRRMNGAKPEDAIENILNAFARSRSNAQVVESVLAKWE